MKEIQAVLVAIPAHLQVHAERVRAAGKHAITAAWKFGQELCDARRAAKHGEWTPFLKTLGIAERTARRWMRVAVQMEHMSDVERKNATSMQAVLESSAPAPGIGTVSESGGPDGGLQIGHVAGMGTRGSAGPIDFCALDAAAERLLRDKALGGPQPFVQDDKRWRVGGEEYRTHPWLATLPEMDQTTVESLADSIRKIGQLDPVVVDPQTQTVVDGRGRITACALAGVAVKWIRLPASQSATAMVWRSNVVRQNLRPQERAQVLAQLEVLENHIRFRRFGRDGPLALWVLSSRATGWWLEPLAVDLGLVGLAATGAALFGYGADHRLRPGGLVTIASVACLIARALTAP